MKLFKKASMFAAVSAMAASLVACGNPVKAPEASGTGTVESAIEQSSEDTAEGTTQTAKAFPKFKGTDFDGNEVDDSIFSKNEVTLLNFWFNGCSACVDEMPALEKFNASLKEKGAELIGVNVQAGESDKDLQEAKDILAAQGATYKNIYMNSGKEIDDYISTIYGFPTTVLVNKEGKIIGEPLLGSLDDEARLNEVLKMVESTSKGEEVSSANTADKDEKVSSANIADKTEDEINALIDEENKIYEENIELWAKVMDSIPHEKAASVSAEEYISLLKEQIEALKDSFTEEELKTLNDDISRIEEIEKKITAAEKG